MDKGDRGEMKRKWQERLKKVEELASHYERNPLPTVYRPRLSKPSMPSSVWKIFSRQAEAFNYVKACEELVSQKLKEFYDVNCSSEDVLNLDSSTDEKFSRHLIFLPQKTVFKDNTHIGNFVRTILQPAIRLLQSRAAVIPTEEAENVFQCSAGAGLDGSLTNLPAVEDDSKDRPAIAHETKDVEMPHQGENLDFSFLIVNDKEGNKQLFVDLGVYTKNRNFRLYKSSKAGKNVILKIAEDNKFIPNCEKDVFLEEAYFLSSLICNIGASDDIKVLSSGFSEEERKMSAFLNSKTTRSSRDPMEGYQGSPYPEIDNFVRSLVNKDGLQGGIRQWSYFSLKELLIYDIYGYRWCENIGRAHKSNNIMILVDLKNEVWYQKCHDPVCREQNFKSQSFPLPPGICLPSLFKEEEESMLMDDRGHTEGKVPPHSHVSDLSKSSVSPETSCSQDFLLSDSEWENTSDDACFLEAAEDVELAEAADDSLNYGMEEIPDEVLLEALGKEDLHAKEGS
ncbi:DNA-directed primase/polymerase protein isoform X4 [Ammospiza nelsoni]|uniref:DNA-directed primase/polymerase protein isoform X4 n=1 Tax=Ammospiza nelsoni TaxID=2857394 RepID=UPI00286AD3FF|nr:DNA-directed primase/polymerase protein isoform X4 [Ammospiza nelsoni]